VSEQRKPDPRKQRIGRYLLDSVIASGGMATVHVGRLLASAGFSRTVAIKRLHPQFTNDPDFAAMFLEEARVAGRVRHANVVSIIDVVSEDGEILLVMEYIPGESLAALLRTIAPTENVIPPPIVAAIACDALEGLHAAHETCDEHGEPLDIVHRDVSPQNILVGTDGVSRVLDFGIAKATGRAHVTRDGQVKGKLAYMSPEQLHGTTTRATDIHAMGIVLWELLTEQRLFTRENEGATVTKILTHAVEAPSKAGAQTDVFDAVVLKALEKDPAARFSSAREMALEISRCVPRADAREVSEWIQRIAKPVLDERKELVAKVESGAERSPEVSIPVDLAAETRADVSTDVRRSRRSSSLPWIAGAGVALVAIGVLVAMSMRSQKPPEPAAPARPDISHEEPRPSVAVATSASPPPTSTSSVVSKPTSSSRQKKAAPTATSLPDHL
jgi:serine/threonine-protein kinase